MKSRIFILVLWALVAILLVRACLPSKTPADTAVGAVALEDFSQPAASDYPLVLENDFLRSEWSALGASCGRVLLKKYTTERVSGTPGPEDWLVLHDSRRVIPKVPRPGANGANYYRKRDAFRLVETSDLLFPPDPATGAKANLDSVTWTVEPNAASNGLSFSWTAPNGVKIVKSINLVAGTYHLESSVAVIAPADAGPAVLGQTLALRLGTGGGIETTPDPYYRNPWVACGMAEYGQLEDVEFYFPDGTLPGSRAVAKRWTGAIPFVAEGSKYFLSAIHSRSKDFSGAVAEVFFDDAAFYEKAKDLPQGIVVDPDSTDFWKRASVGGSFTLHLSPGVAERQEFLWFIGPKDSKLLGGAVYGPLSELPGEADFGTSWFYKISLTHYVAPVILWLLRAFHLVVGNWGVSIILLTILVRVLVFPVTRHSQVKMGEYSARVQKVKPMLDAINQKYASEPKKKQEETMKIYQQHKLTPPVGGCLPILLQMPVFIGLFAALRSSIDLRQQPFAFWIHDLAVPDALVDFGGPVAGFWPLSGIVAFNLLPVVMVVLWILHQRSMPRPTDPQQLQMYKIMAIMPVIFGLVLYNYASGLSLYMITSSALGILEQKVIRKRWPVPTPAMSGTVIPPASGKKK
jgi:YidC/Oxa1 family membrane protein insertase